MLRRGRVAWVVVAGGVATLALAGCGSGPGGGGGGGTGSGSVQLLDAGTSFRDVSYYAMINNDFGRQNGLTLSFANFGSGGGSTSQIFAGGTGDVLSAGIDGVAAIGQKNKIPITVIGAWANYDYHQLVSKAGSRFTTLASLKGGTVAVSGAGSFSDYAVRYLLKQNGLQPDKDVKIASISGDAAMAAAVSSGRVDAADLTPPTATQALLDHRVQTIYKFESRPLPATLYIARTADVKKDPAKFSGFMKAYVQAVTKLRSDPAFAQQVTAAWAKSRQLTIPPAVQQQLLGEFVASPGVWSADGKFTQQLYEAGKDMLVGSGKVQADSIPSYAALTQDSP